MIVEPHRLLDIAAFITHWPVPLGRLPVPEWLDAMSAVDFDTSLPAVDEGVKTRVRDVLRGDGFKPAGRNKPCAEYIRAAAHRDAFPRINIAVDACNVAVLHGGLPISCVDHAAVGSLLRVGIAPVGSRYVFNPSGQAMDLGGLVCLWDDQGPCANAVKDAQRVKTSDRTVRTLSLLWGTVALPGRTVAVSGWYQELVRRLGGRVDEVTLRRSSNPVDATSL